MSDDRYSREPDKVVSKDFSDLKVEFGKVQSSVEHLQKDTVTHAEFEKWKVDFANWKLETVKWVIQLAIPLLVLLLAFFLNSLYS